MVIYHALSGSSGLTISDTFKGYPRNASFNNPFAVTACPLSVRTTLTSAALASLVIL